MNPMMVLADDEGAVWTVFEVSLTIHGAFDDLRSMRYPQPPLAATLR